MAACSHHLANRRAADRTVKRGGRSAIVPFDRLGAEGRSGREPAVRLTPERLFDRQWALALLGRALGRLECEWVAAGKAELFARLRPGLQGDGSAATYRTIAAKLGTFMGLKAVVSGEKSPSWLFSALPSFRPMSAARAAMRWLD